MNGLRSIAAILLGATGLIDIPYGWFYVAGFASYIWYAMGAIYLITAGAVAVNVRPGLFQLWALGYTLFLLSAWATGGSRDLVAFVDKAIETLLAINLVMLIRAKWTSTLTRPI